MKFTAVVCTYNRCESLADTLAALKRQSLDDGLTLEILVVDNNSKDRTRQVAEELGRLEGWPLRCAFEPVQGLSAARNRGVREAAGEFIAFTDDDVIPDARWIQNLFEAFRSRRADAVGGKVLLKWLVPAPEWILEHKLEGMLGKVDHGGKAFVADKADEGLLCGSNMAFRKSVLETVGDFRTDLGVSGKKMMRGEETELLVRCFEAGKRVAYEPGAVVYHKVQAERVKKNYFRKLRFHTFWSLALISVADTRHVANGVPLWLVRECAVNSVAAAGLYLRGLGSRAFRREMIFWAQLGQIAGGYQRVLDGLAGKNIEGGVK